jgi:4,4'-diaponeurosporenoate glycosyltransferase
MIWFAIPILVSLLIGIFLFYKEASFSIKKKPFAATPKISVIIPARNEENNLPRLLNSLKNQTIAPYEIIVVDDNSSDRTAQKAQEHAAQVISSPILPDGWLGKPWSCYLGAQKAKGDIFIFLDADTFLEKDGLEKMINVCITKKGATSIFPYHSVKKFHEAFSAIFNLMQIAGMYYIYIFGKREPKGLLGPCLVISQKDYLEAGGHLAVKGQVLEHYAMGGILKKHGISLNLISGKGLLNVRMYPEGWRSLINGWRKSFARGADQTPWLNMTFAIIWISGLIVTSAFFLSALFSGILINIYFWASLYLLSVIQVYYDFRRVGNFPLWSAVFYPAILIFFLALFIVTEYSSSKNSQIEWKGRKIY